MRVGVPLVPMPCGHDKCQVSSPRRRSRNNPAAVAAAQGESAELRVGGDGRTIFLKFNVQNVGSVASATLRLQAFNGGYGGDVYRVDDTSWVEESLNYEDMPAWDAEPLASLGWVEAGETYEVTVSDAVACDGEVALAIRSSEEDGAGFWSKESTGESPRLILATDATGEICGSGTEPDDDVAGPPDEEPGDNESPDTDPGDGDVPDPESPPEDVPDPESGEEPDDAPVVPEDVVVASDGWIPEDGAGAGGPLPDIEPPSGIQLHPSQPQSGGDDRPIRSSGAGCGGASPSNGPGTLGCWFLLAGLVVWRRRDAPA